jgi:hypothetical protein
LVREPVRAAQSAHGLRPFRTDDRRITYGTQSTNTYSVQVVDSAGNRSPLRAVTLTGQTC